MRLTPTKAIRVKCMDCCCQQQAEVRRCSVKTCALWRFRMGREERDELYHTKYSNQKNLTSDGVNEDSEGDGE